ncbi:ATP-dependent zinc protease [Pseudomonas sp. H3(2019)]|uniref:retropepsin-like aspartic peptidase RloA3 n=1 Tax=Pseudomonas sp. H3(2019) TaxID=2598724 RepID=UPI0011928103|nr:ATP-dependent zinc protease [Pseudomonas sp. H3(2019)]TVT81677.1 ATP-dependent zinc protease [Pseudomonas sp. H3(2019)]
MIWKVFNWAALPIFFALAASPAFSATTKTEKVFGWVEEGIILPESITVKVKLDTGALTSSMDAKDLERYRKDGEEWVRFKVEVKDTKTKKLTSALFERPVERNVKVRGAGGAEHRPVVTMSMCIGNKVYSEEFSLRDRGNMNYPVLIGRRTLEGLGAVDVSRTFTQEPECVTD